MSTLAVSADRAGADPASEGIAHTIATRFRDQGDKLALVDHRGHETSYAELLSHLAYGRELVKRAHLEPGSRVILQTESGVPFTVAALALLLEGHLPVGIETAQGSDVYQDRADYVSASAVLVSKRVAAVQRTPLLSRSLLKAGIQIPPVLSIKTISWATEPSGELELGAGQSTDPETPALVVFSGGTTSLPKGVVLSHRSVASYLSGLEQIPEWSGLESIVADHPQQVLYGLAHGKTVYLSTPRAGRRADHVAELLFGQGVQGYFGSPPAWEAILDTGRHRSADRFPKAALMGGARVTRSLLERFESELGAGVGVRCLYGMTELGLIAHLSGPEKLALLRAGSDGDPIGTLLPGVTARTDAHGELLVATASRFLNYLGDPPTDPGSEFATGDLAEVEDNRVTLTGRRKNMIVQNGVNLYAGQFEPRLETLLDSAVLVGVEHGLPGDEAFVLFYISRSGIGEDEAQRLAANVLPAGHAPIMVVRLERMPTQGRQNKIDRTALALTARSTLAGADFIDSLRAETVGALRGALADAPAKDRVKGRLIEVASRKNLASVRRSAQRRGPRLRAVPPVFILGHQRSGTTFLHRSLAESSNAVCFTLGQMLRPTARAWRMADRFPRFPANGKLPMGAHLASIDERHSLGLGRPEEEEFLFAALGLSGFIPSAFPQAVADQSFERVRDRSGWDDQSVTAFIGLYRDVLEKMWEYKGAGPDHRHLAKNPAFGPIASYLDREFVGARFVVALRDPLAAISSRLGLFEALYDRPLSRDQIEAVVADSIRQLRGLAEQVSLIDPGKVHLVSFEDLVENPKVVLERTARFAGLETSNLAGTMASHTPRPVEPELYGLSRESLTKETTEYTALCSQGKETT